MLHDYPTSIHVVRQIVTKRIRVDEREIAERHNDVVLLEFSQSGRADHGIEEVYRDHIGFGKDFGLQLRGQTLIRIDDEHLEMYRVPPPEHYREAATQGRAGTRAVCAPRATLESEGSCDLSTAGLCLLDRGSSASGIAQTAPKRRGKTHLGLVMP